MATLLSDRLAQSSSTSCMTYRGQDKEAVKRKRAFAALDDEDAAGAPKQARPPAQARPGAAHAAAPASAGGPPRTMLRLRFNAVRAPSPPPAQATWDWRARRNLIHRLHGAGFLCPRPLRPKPVAVHLMFVPMPSICAQYC